MMRVNLDVIRVMYAGYSVRHFHQRIVDQKNSATGKHFIEALGDISLLKESHVNILRKSYMRCFSSVKELHPNLNTHSDSICAKVFVSHNICIFCISFFLFIFCI